MKNIILFFCSFLVFYNANAQVIITIAGNGTPGYSGNGRAATLAELNSPYNLAVDNKGNVYISDTYNRRIRMVNTSGIISNICGNGFSGYFGDGDLAIYSQISGSVDMSFDKIGNIYFADEGNNCIRKIDTFGYISTIAGNGSPGFSGDNGPATSATLCGPTGLAIDQTGSIYVYDYCNYRIRKIDTTGVIKTIAGIGTMGFSPDGTAATAVLLNAETTLRIDKLGNLYFGDNFRIRSITTAGVIKTVAGTGVSGFSGNGGPATAAEIEGGISISIDTSGSIYLADGVNVRVRKIGSDGVINTIAGTGYAGFSGDGGDPLLAQLGFVEGVAVDGIGQIYVSDNSNERIRLITSRPLGIPDESRHISTMDLSPNPAHDFIDVSVAASTNEFCTITIRDVLGKQVDAFSVATNKRVRHFINFPAGLYIVSARTGTQCIVQKMLVL